MVQSILQERRVATTEKKTNSTIEEYYPSITTTRS